MTKRTRLLFLDASRGFCMLLVILGHIWETDAPIPTLIYSFHIPLFFIISGILLWYTDTPSRSWGGILRSRVRGLIAPYLFFELVFVAIFGIRNHFDFGAQRVWDGLLMNPLNVPLWFLPTLFVTELLLILLLKLEKSGKLMAAVCAILYLIPFFADQRELPLMAVLMRCLTSSGFLAAGYLAGRALAPRTPEALKGFHFRDQWISFAVFLAVLLLDGALALANGKVGIYKLTFGNPLLFTLCASAGSFCCLFAFRNIPSGSLPSRLLAHIGENTMAILGLHIIVLRILQQILGLDTDSLTGGLLALAAICVLLIPAELFFNRFFPLAVGKKRQP